MKLEFDQLKPGMQVERDILNHNRVILLSAGTELSEHHLRTLKTCGIAAVHVAGEGADEEAAKIESNLPPELIRAAEERVNFRFKHVKLNHPSLVRLRELAIKRTAANLARKNTKPAR